MVLLLALPTIGFSVELTQQESFTRLSPVALQAEINSLVSPELMCSSNDDPRSLYEKYSDEISKLRDMLSRDDTDEIPYVLGHFSCHNYSKRLYLQHSNQVQSLDAFHLEDMEREWTTTINRSEDAKFELYTVTLTSPEEGYFHAINAVLLDKDNPQDINSYVFIEPQSDKLLLAEDLRSHSNRLMNRNMTAPIKIDVGTFDQFKFNGNIWQTFSSTKVSFTDS